MAGEFTKSSTLTPAIAGTLAKAQVFNQNLALIAKDSFIPVDVNGTPADGDLGDETIGTNGTLIEDCKVRDGKSLKIYDASGILLNTALWSNIILGTSYIDKYAISGLVPSSNAVTPDEKIDVTIGRCISEDGSIILELSSPATANLTTHITPSVDTFHLFLYRNASSGLDILDFSTSLTPTAGTGDANLPNLDPGKYRRICSVVTDATSDIIPILCNKLAAGAIDTLIDLTVGIPDIGTITTTSTSRTLTSIPVGIAWKAHLETEATWAGGADTKFYYSSSKQPIPEAQTHSDGAAAGYFLQPFDVNINDDATVLNKYTGSNPSSYDCNTKGWIDNRNYY